jgi:hypothetical protein
VGAEVAKPQGPKRPGIVAIDLVQTQKHRRAREHSLFFRRLLPRPVLDSVPVAGKDPVKGSMVCGAAQGQHLVGVGHSPTMPLTA